VPAGIEAQIPDVPELVWRMGDVSDVLAGGLPSTINEFVHYLNDVPPDFQYWVYRTLRDRRNRQMRGILQLPCNCRLIPSHPR
jgi:hypothetical protein